MSNADDVRARADELIAIADKIAEQPLPPAQRVPRRWPAVALGLLGVAVLVAGIVLGNRGDDATGAPATAAPAAAATAASGQPTSDSAAAPATDPIGTGAAATPTTGVPPSTVPPSTVPPSTGPADLIDPDAPVRWAEFTGGKVYLQGRVPDQATADEIRDKTAAVVGADNVVVQYEIVPGTPRPASAPLYVRDSALFTPGDVDINDQARGVLDLGVALMQQNPSVTIDIHGYTDSTGTDEYNLDLSQQRVDAMFNYLVFMGIDPVRLTKTAHGEADPVADNATDEGRAKNRRVEFTINNLLG
ncbi:MAG: OmpA family protein [Actinomycetota bacterium]|nr:OmpA family protein [Actinomycetota bacterium]